MTTDRTPAVISAGAGTVQSVVIVTSIAYSLANFRGDLIRTMVANGLHVYAMAPDYDDYTRNAVISLGAEPVDISLERAGMRPAADLRDMVRLAAQLRRLGPDLLFCYFVKPVIYGTLAGWLAGIPRRFALVAGLGYVYTANGTETNFRRRLLRLGVSNLYRIAFRLCRRVFFQNDDDIAEFVDAGLIDRTRALRLAGSGVDLVRLAEVAPVRKPIVFLLMARLLREKGIEEYVEAARCVKAAYPETRFVLLGGVDPNPGGIDEATVRGWAAEGSIEWPGHVNDVLPWIAGCSVYVLPSYREGVPRSTQEAMAIGRAVITTDVPGCRDTVKDGINGFLIPPRDSDSLAQVMLRFIADPGLIDTMGRQSRRLAEERFDVHRINAVMLDAMGLAPISSSAVVAGTAES